MTSESSKQQGIIPSSPGRLRQFVKKGAGSLLFRSRAFQSLRMAKRYVSSLYLSRIAPDFFKDISSYVIFIGHMKSGGSMISALLDAHPNAVFSDENNALHLVEAGFGRDQLYHVLVRNSRKEAKKGRVTARRIGGYSWLVPNQWQGKHQTIKVIGDCTTGASTRALSLHHELLMQAQELMKPALVKFIHVIRNPYDPIAVMMIRGKRTFENALESYFSGCEMLVGLRNRIPGEFLLPVRYEDFIADPKRSLAGICGFLGLEAGEDYLNACAGIVHTSDRSRQLVNWKPEWIESVQKEIGQYDFLQGYTFES